MPMRDWTTVHSTRQESPPPTQILCKLAYWCSTLLGFAALVLIWLFYPSTYNYGQALGDSHFFLKTQRVGKLPDKSVSWRGDSLLQEYALKFNGKTYDFGGGYMTVPPPPSGGLMQGSRPFEGCRQESRHLGGAAPTPCSWVP